MKIITFLFGLFSITNALESVDVNINYYTGLWYQTYGDKFVLSTFERDAYCVCANYTALNENTIEVYNWERVGSPSGEIQDIHGYAETTEEPGQLIVHFPGTNPSPYWVINTGPIIDDKYQYSIVSDPYMLGLYVLTRNVDDYYELYNEEVLEFLNQTGYNKLYNKPIQVVHDGCTYF